MDARKILLSQSPAVVNNSGRRTAGISVSLRFFVARNGKGRGIAAVSDDRVVNSPERETVSGTKI